MRKRGRSANKLQNMVMCLERLKMGTLSATKLKEIDSRRRIKELSVSRLMDLKQAQDGSVAYLDLDAHSGRFLLSACNSGSIYIHDLANETGDLRHECQVVAECSQGSHDFSCARLETAQWYPLDTGLFTTSGGNSQLRVWDGNQLRVIETVDVKATIHRHHMCPVPSSSSCLIAVATESEHVYLVDIRTGNSVRELRGHHDSVNACAFSPRDGDLLVTGGMDGQMLLWDVRMARGFLLEMPPNDSRKKWRENKPPHEKPSKPKKDLIKSVCFSSDGRSAVFVSRSSKIRSWNFYNDNKSKSVCEFSGMSSGQTIRVQMDVSPDLDMLFVPDKCAVAIYSMKTGKLLNSLNDHYGLVNCCRYNAFSPELYSGGMDHIIVPYRSETEITRGFTVDLEKIDEPLKKNVGRKFHHNPEWDDSDSDE